MICNWVLGAFGWTTQCTPVVTTIAYGAYGVWGGYGHHWGHRHHWR